MEIGRYYLEQGDYLAAMNRFKRVIDNYQTTTHVPEALERLTECYLALGLVGEARRNAAVLGYQLSRQRVVRRRFRPAEGEPGTRRDDAELGRPDPRQHLLIPCRDKDLTLDVLFDCLTQQPTRPRPAGLDEPLQSALDLDTQPPG